MVFKSKKDYMELADYWKNKAERKEKKGNKLESKCCYKHYEYYKKIALKMAY